MKNTKAPLPTSYMEINRVHQATLAKQEGTVVVTAPTGGCGTTLVCHLVALRAAENGRKTLLIDLNLKDAALSVNLQHERLEWRLTERGPDDLLNDLYQAVQGVENLYFMAAPRDEASVAFLKDPRRAALFFACLERQFNHVVVDTTSIAQLNRYNIDPVVLAAAAKKTVLVVMTGRTRIKALERAAELLKQAEANLLGVIMNDRFAPSKRDALLQFIDPLRRLSPGLYGWLRYKILHAEV